jgi:hypothetical protein
MGRRRQLAETKKSIALGEKFIARQRTLIVALEQKGRDTSKAQALLDRLEQEQAMQVAERDRLLLELGE